MATTLISVVVPTFNRAEMLGEALQSLIRQDTQGAFSYELVVVDNASTDSTKTIIQRAAQESPVSVRYIYHTTPGDAPSRNRGLAEARGKWIAFFDDDELAAPDWLYQLHLAAVTSARK